MARKMAQEHIDRWIEDSMSKLQREATAVPDDAWGHVRRVLTWLHGNENSWGARFFENCLIGHGTPGSPQNMSSFYIDSRTGGKPVVTSAGWSKKIGKRDVDASIKALRAAMPSPRRNPAARRSNGLESDQSLVTELVLAATNDGDLYRQRIQPIITNLAKKKAKGVYDHAKAVKLMAYAAEDGARKYGFEAEGGRGWNWHKHPMPSYFTAAIRRAAAAEMLDSYMEEIDGQAAELIEKAAAKGSKRKRNPVGDGSTPARRLSMKSFKVTVMVVPSVFEMQAYGAQPTRETRTIKGYTLKDAKKRAGIE